MANSAPRRVVVDDSDPRIIYSSDFFVDNTGSQDANGNFGPTFKSSLHGTNSSGSLQFRFSGTQIRAYGTINQLTMRSGRVDPTWECFIDGISIGRTNPFQFAENNWNLCSSGDLNDTSHTLTINANSNGRTFWFDYLRYIPSAGASLDNALIHIDHNDAAIRYDPHWEPLGEIANMTSTAGSKVVFDFIGESLQWYSLIPTELPHTPSFGTYSVDGELDTAFALQGLPTSTSVTEYNQLAFQTPILAYGYHSITVTFRSDNTSTPLNLAYLLVQNGTQLSNPIVATSTSFPTATPSSFSTGAVKQAHVGSIVGGVLGTLAFLLSIIAAYLLYQQYRQRHANDPTVKNTIPIPFYTTRPRPRSSSRPNPRVPEVDSISSQRSLNQPHEQLPPMQVFELGQPPSHRRRQSHGRQRSMPQASGSTQVAPPEAVQELDENTPYYGGYQTWGQAKALEAKSRAQRPRDSYM